MDMALAASTPLIAAALVWLTRRYPNNPIARFLMNEQNTEGA